MKKAFMMLAMVALFAMPMQTQEKKMENLETVKNYLQECKTFYVATVDGDQPRVRPFGVAEVYNGRLYIMTGKKKDVFKQMVANPKFEITAVKPSGAEWIRVSGRLVSDDDVKAKEFLLDKNPSLKGMYSATDDNMAILYIVDGEARLCSFMGAEKKVKF
ncbi:MAG: pyridoxamine 5'-phosphate oxidase family protein [Bacteroidaceae bacterium]|nr:pyridoxamine 5'-phosphate oxidase family protein [Bacteroidaceae bacterium]